MLTDATQLLRDARTLDMQAFGNAAFAWLRRQIIFDTGTLITSFSKEPTVQDVHFFRLPPQLLADWAKVAHLNQGGRDMLARPGEAINSCEARYYADKAHAPVRELFERYGIRHSLGIAIPQPCGVLTTVCLVHRENADFPFTEADRQSFQQIAAALIEVWAVNRILCAGTLTPREEPEGPMALVSHDGWVLYATTDWARAISGELTSHNPHVPAELWEAPLSKEIEWQGGAWYATREPAQAGYVIRLRAAHATDDLGAREKEVARLYAQGLSHKEIARELALSPNTIRNHLQNVFRKLAVSNRRALALRLNAPQ